MEKWYLKNLEKNLADLFTFLSIKSISTNDQYEKELLDCANWLVSYINDMGLSAKAISTSKNPVVFAQNVDFDEKKKTILIYGHYDVQPVDPIEEWDRGPFSPYIKDNKIFARGASDNKGQVFYSLLAIKAFLENNKELPFNIKFCIEGGEEIGSKGLLTCLKENKELFAATYLLAIDFLMLGEKNPSIVLGARGVVALEATFTGSKTDLHSGEFGGIAYNPLRAVSEVIAKLHDSDGKINIPNFYDDVIEIEKKGISTDFSKEKYEKEFGINAFHKEKGYTTLQSNWFRPTVEINGIGGGYFDVGVKTVIPKEVVVKLSSRIVPNQSPKKIGSLIREFLIKNVPSGMKVDVNLVDLGFPVLGSRDNTLAKALKVALEEVFQKEVQYSFCGPSIPILADMVDNFYYKPVFFGMGLSSDLMHAPNEHFSLDRLKNGFSAIYKTLGILRREVDGCSNN